MPYPTFPRTRDDKAYQQWLLSEKRSYPEEGLKQPEWFLDPVGLLANWAPGLAKGALAAPLIAAVAPEAREEAMAGITAALKKMAEQVSRRYGSRAISGEASMTESEVAGIRKLAGRLSASDFLQAGREGVLKYMGRPGTQYPSEGFEKGALSTARGYMSKLGKTNRQELSRQEQVDLSKINKFIESYKTRFGHEPSDFVIAVRTHVLPARVSMLRSNQPLVYIQEPVPEWSQAGQFETLGDRLTQHKFGLPAGAVKQSPVSLSEATDYLKSKGISDRDSQVYIAYNLLGDQKLIAKKMGVHQTVISDIILRVNKKLGLVSPKIPEGSAGPFQFGMKPISGGSQASEEDILREIRGLLNQFLKEDRTGKPLVEPDPNIVRQLRQASEKQNPMTRISNFADWERAMGSRRSSDEPWPLDIPTINNQPILRMKTEEYGPRLRLEPQSDSERALFDLWSRDMGEFSRRFPGSSLRDVIEYRRRADDIYNR